MRAPFQKAPAPRIRALTGAPSRPKAQAAPQSVFRDFVATLERLEKGRRKKRPAEKPAPGGREA
ncbi:hypothetical protein [Xanthobacter tagetidis]|jgi:hypothetical protein|uniref:Uncharacterized protein n=1 Tax=Xanthobacter tagetidis TaxID=60216 RepID=A0A3L7AHH5_9HYPH|nr:hypothetical protein [Xanthobacter tagetidis]MBB6307011.1 hypothetical protein [Xanthobacter tagetidis]RLP79936.1 hypothetical protein D9R14_06120 [Xanthobacter tagetidis]